MRFQVNNLKKSFGKRILFSNFNFDFKENRFYCIVGDSGSGKTTLLKILALLEANYDGEIQTDELVYSKLDEKQRRDFRLKNFGFIFQNYNLFEEDSVINNIRLTLDGIIEEKEEVKVRRINEIINLLKLTKVKNTCVKNLSGGEKQRVAIARALITSPKIIFCDEPTGSLDEQNTKLIFESLSEISAFSTIICVTHDKNNAKKYSDIILELKDEKIVEVFHEIKNKEYQTKIMKLSQKKHFGRFSLSFIKNHLKVLFKNRKIRNLIKNFLFSVSLISGGLAITLTNSLNTSINSSFSSIVSGNEIVLTKKDSSNQVLDYYSTSEQSIHKLLANYHEDLNRYGVNYIVDFENYFPDGNGVYSINQSTKINLEGFTIRHFNEFICVDDFNKYDIYPSINEELDTDEVVISINYDQMKSMCLELQILRDFVSLGNYLKDNDYYISLEVANYSWQYSDEQVFKVKGVIFDNKNRIYHTNSLFNEILFEEQMRFPTSNRFNKVEDYPWVFKKVYYIETKKFQNIFLDKVFYDERYKDFIFEIDSETYRPLTYESKLSKNYIYVFNCFKDAIDITILKALKDAGINFENYYFSTPAGYYNNGTNIFTGFNNPTFFSMDLEKLNYIIDAHSRVNVKDIYNINSPDNVVDAFALKPSSDNLKFKIIDEPMNIKEIIISQGFARILNENELIGKEIYITMLTNSTLNGEMVDTTFKTIKLKINGIINDDRSVAIYQNKNFSISLFRDLFGISTFRLIPNSIILNTSNKISESELDKLNSMFDQYIFLNPLIEIEKSVAESTYFLKFILFSFALISLISSIILSVIITIINTTEQKSEIALFKTIGFRNSEISKIFLFESSINGLLCLFTSILSLILINALVGSNLGKSLGVSSLNLFSPLAFITILLITCFIVCCSFICVKKALKEDVK